MSSSLRLVFYRTLQQLPETAMHMKKLILMYMTILIKYTGIRFRTKIASDGINTPHLTLGLREVKAWEQIAGGSTEQQIIIMGEKLWLVTDKNRCKSSVVVSFCVSVE